MNLKGIGSVAASGSDTATAVIDPKNGTVKVRTLNYTSPAAGTLKAYRGRFNATANAAVSASATLVIDTDSAGKVGGAVLTTNDYVLVESAANGWQLRSISNVGAVSSSTVSLTLGSAITCAADDRVWVIRAADIASITTGTETVNGLYDAFVSYSGGPLALQLAATGTCTLTASWEEWA
jgi:hypothetical protein